MTHCLLSRTRNFTKAVLNALISVFIAVAFLNAYADDNQELKLVPDMQWLPASAHLDSLEIIQGLSDDYWQAPPDSAMTLGFVDGIYWVRAAFLPPAAGEWIFSANNPTLREVTLWHKDSTGEFQLVGKAGIDLPFHEGRQFLVSDFLFQLHITDDSQQEILLRVKQTGLFDLPASLQSKETAINSETSQAYSNGFFYGLFLVALLFALVYFIATHDLSFLAFGVFISGTLLFFGYTDGIIGQVLWPNIPQLNMLSAQIALPLLNVGIPWFSLTFLNIPNKNFRLKQVLYLQLWTATILVFSSYWLNMIFILFGGLLMTLLAIATSLIASFRVATQRKDRIAAFYALTWLFFGSYISFIASSVFGLVPFAVHDLMDALKIAFAMQTAFLMAALAVRFQALEAQGILAKSQSRSKSELLTRVSHEIRTPMNGILGLSRLLEEHVTSEQGQYYRKLIIDSSEALLHVVNDLLDSRQIEEGKIELHKAPVQLTSLVRNTFETLRNQIESKGLEAELTLPDTDEWISGDEVRLRQIIINLLGNAVKFTHEGKISCALQYDQQAKTYQLIISDTGKGISLKDQERILQPFEQVGRSKTEIYEGTGLGLYITNQLIKLMNGEFLIDSTPGKGTRISVILPAVVVPAPNQKLKDGLAMATRKLTILAAEDNLTNQVILKKILQNLGHSYKLAHNGEEAYQLFKEQKFDLVLMDCEMPILNGYEATKKIRTFEHENNLSATPIYALTAHAVTEHIARVKEVGMDGQLTKPFNSSQLAELINNC